MKNAVYRQTIEKFRNRVDVKLVNNEKDYLKCTSKSGYMLHKVFDNNLVGIPKCKLALKHNKPAYIGMWIFEQSKVLMYELHCDYIKNKYDNKSKQIKRICWIEAKNVFILGIIITVEKFQWSDWSNGVQLNC